MGYKLSDFVNDFKNTLGSTAGHFKAVDDADFHRHIKRALIGLSKHKRRTLLGEVTLQAGIAFYDVPDDLISFKYSDWGHSQRKPWEKGFCYAPRATQLDRQLFIHPAPTLSQIHEFGESYTFYYLATHLLDEDETISTITDDNYDLLMLLCLVEAVRELAVSNLVEPIQLHNGMGALSNQNTPKAMLEVLLQQVELMA